MMKTQTSVLSMKKSPSLRLSIYIATSFVPPLPARPLRPTLLHSLLPYLPFPPPPPPPSPLPFLSAEFQGADEESELVAALHEEAAAEAELEDTKAHVSPRGPSASSNAPSELMEAAFSSPCPVLAGDRSSRALSSSCMASGALSSSWG